MNKNIEKSVEYILKYNDSIVHDKKDFIQLKFNNLSNLKSKLPNFFTNYAPVKILITYYQQTFEVLTDFYKEIELSYNNEIDEFSGNISVTFDKNKLISLHNLLKLDNVVIYFNANNFLNDISNIHFNNNKFKLNAFLIEGFSEISENDYIRFQNLGNIPDKLSNTPIDSDSINTYKLINKIYSNKDIDCYTKIPHFWFFSNYTADLVILNQKCILTFFDVISNKVLSQKGKYLIKGHHNLTFNIVIDDAFYLDGQKLIELLEFTLDEDRHYDKLLILRNVITRHLNDNSDIVHFSNQIEHIVDTANHDFELYIQNEVKIFIDQKNHLLNETLSVAKQVAHQTQYASNHIRNLLITLIGAIIASTISTISDLSNDKQLLSLFIVMIIIYLGINLFISNNIKVQHKNNMNSLKNYIESISNTSLKGLDFNNLKAKFINPEEKNLFKTLTVYNIINFILIFTSLFVLFYINKEIICHCFL